LPQFIIPVNLLNCTIPSFTSLELESCDINWKSPLLKGLQNLKISKPSRYLRPKVPKLEDWLDALNEMPQLKTLILKYATPLAPRTTSLAARIIPGPSRTVTLPSLTKFHIAASARDCGVALAHLMMPSLTRLVIDAESRDEVGQDVQQLIPYVARNVYVLQADEPLWSVLISTERIHTKVVAWTMPGADAKDCDPSTLYSAPGPARLYFALTGRKWNYGLDTAIFDAFVTLFPVNSVSSLTAEAHLFNEFWLSHAPRWPLLKRVRLVPEAVKGFREMLGEDPPPDGPRLPWS
jgi:hypothetical protein